MNKKKSLNISDKQVLVGQFLASGKTMNKWCQDKGISTSTFHA